MPRYPQHDSAKAAMLRRSARLKRRTGMTVGGPSGWIWTSAIFVEAWTAYKAGLIEVKRR
jgi:hypothetical protein